MPFSILVAAGTHLGIRTTKAMAPPGLTSVIDKIGAPLALSVPVIKSSTLQESPAALIPALFTALWAIGFVILVCSWWLSWQRIHAALGTASLLRLPVELKVLTSPDFGEPSVFGICRPVLLFPVGLIRYLTPSQLDAILKHELCHVRRRDNLVAAIHMAVQAVFWFHPIVWWLAARLNDERERACDEEVLRMGSEPQAYAEGILKVCELYMDASLQHVAGVTGGNLKRRIEAIMNNRPVCKLDFTRKALLALSAVTAIASPIAIGILNAPLLSAQQTWQTTAGGKIAFEVASIKPDRPGAQFKPPSFPMSDEEAYADTGGRLLADFPVTVYIQFAYKIRLTQEQMRSMLAHLPKWVANDRFVIQAKAAKSNPTKDQMRLMMQSLLADRFQLALHFETKEIPVLALTLVKPGKIGPKLLPHSDGPPCDAPASINVFPARCEVTSFERQASGNLAGSRNTTIDLLAAALPSLDRLDRPVVNQTGLSGRFDFRLEWIPEPTGSAPASLNAQPDMQGVSFLQALREQLGMKLHSTTGPIQTPVIDRIERPSEN